MGHTIKDGFRQLKCSLIVNLTTVGKYYYIHNTIHKTEASESKTLFVKNCIGDSMAFL